MALTGTGSYVPRNIRLVIRRSAIAASVVGVVAAVVLVLMGQAMWAVFVLIGLGLGVANLVMVQRAASMYAARAGTGKKGFAIGAFGRLAIISVIGVGCAFLFRPAGIGVIVGVAVFQFIAAIVAALPITREVRTW
jgi:hypothetical protein